MRHLIRLALVGGALALVAPLTLLGGARASTTTQIDRGLQVYKARCAECHGRELEGGWGPALEDTPFQKKYPTFDALFHFVRDQMPFEQGGTLPLEEYYNVTLAIRAHNGERPDGFAEPGIRERWTIVDQPVASGAVRRSFTWGPTGIAVMWEDYAEAPGGSRLVQYFDKARLEITNLDAPRTSVDRVSSGLLAKELVTGRVQTGRDRYEDRTPATVVVAGDENDTAGPTYATFAALVAPAAPRTGPVTATIDRAGTIGRDDALGVHTEDAAFVPETGHTIPRVFWDYLHSAGLLSQGGALVEGALFDPWYGAVGLPITDAYWAKVKVDGQVKDVLIQVFERRALTFTPSNDAANQVQMGNVGRHYLAWRYQPR